MTAQSDLVISLARKIVERRLTISTGGNISYRLSDGKIVITPSKQHKSISDLEPSDLSVVNLTGELIEGPKPSAELPMHLAIHSVTPYPAWVIHAHPPIAMAYSSERILPEEPSIEALKLKISLVDVRTPGSEELAREVAEKVKTGFNILLLEGHGAVVISADPNNAFMLLDELENACKTDLVRRLLRLSNR